MSDELNPCVSCGACCAYFRVSFYWGETTEGGGLVPEHLTEQVTPHLVCMQGTGQRPARCVALTGQIGESVSCSMYHQRSSTCRQFAMSGENGVHNPDCDKARAAHGLPPLPVPVWQPYLPEAEPA
ncbi:MAG: YkgJ family cysteine cluster protein [Plesiomonas shigelloides]